MVVPPVLEDAHPIVAALKERTEPVVARTWSREASQDLSPFEQAVLQTLDAALLFPVVVHSRLVAFLSLGPKRSGDIYTREDVSLLSAAVACVSEELLRFDESELKTETTAASDAFRQYVPGAIAREIASGKEVESGSCEVCVMFVDIRGYTSYAEGREAGEIFSTVSRYTDVVSTAVIDAGGSVVEFNGDGMMAIFGAPNRLPDKEAASIHAGLAILEKLAVTPISGEDHSPISVGIGIATGEAYVGNIRAADRMIWSAIGNTTNLASRLQDLTRTLEASIAIDAVTHERARPLDPPFEVRRHTRIAGRSKPLDVFILPLESRGRAA
jgi:class 3 adenylate cyclase